MQRRGHQRYRKPMHSCQPNSSAGASAPCGRNTCLPEDCCRPLAGTCSQPPWPPSLRALWPAELSWLSQVSSTAEGSPSHCSTTAADTSSCGWLRPTIVYHATGCQSHAWTCSSEQMRDAKQADDPCFTAKEMSARHSLLSAYDQGHNSLPDHPLVRVSQDGAAVHKAGQRRGSPPHSPPS